MRERHFSLRQPSVITAPKIAYIRWNNHELLESQATTGMGATVQDVLEGNGQHVRLLGTGKVGDMSVKRDTLLSSTSLGNGQADTEDGIGTEAGLVGSSIELVEELINLGLVLHINVFLDQSRSNGLVDVLDGLQDTYFKQFTSAGWPMGPLSFFTYPFQATWSCLRHGAHEPRAGLHSQVSKTKQRTRGFCWVTDQWKLQREQ